MITNEQSLQKPMAIVAGIHGYQRNAGSIPWAAAWVGFGYALPVIALVVSLVQGFAKPKES